MARPTDSYRPPSRGLRPVSPPNLRPSDRYSFPAGRSYDPHSSSRRSPPPLRSPPRWNPINGHDRAPGTERRRSRSPPPPRDSYRGGRRDDDRGDVFAGDTYRPSRSDFSFRYDAPPTLDLRQIDNYRPRSPPRPPLRSRQDDNARRDRRRHPGEGEDRRGGRGGFGYRGRGGPRLASERDFLKGNRAPTPELMPGMDASEAHGIKFKAIDDLSDSEEADMDLSADDRSADDAAEQPKKKQARTEHKAAADGDSVPKWSNPDPYTVLPPPDETQKKKKDMVKLIRKARVVSDVEHAGMATDQPDDFISFDLGPLEEELPEPEQEVPGIAGAPTGPRSQRPESPTNGAVTFSLAGKRKVASTQPSKSKVVIDLTSDPALGNRKRDFRDEIRGPPLIHSTQKGRKPAAHGAILPEWRVKPGVAGAPWLGPDHSATANLGVWLHKEIMDFYHYVQPRNFEHVIRTRLVDDLRAVIKRKFASDADIRTFGSFPAGLYLPTADMDLVLVSDEYMRGGHSVFGQSNTAIRKFSQFLASEKLPLPQSTEVILGAKVPLVKYVDQLTGLKVDISFENDTGLTANRTFQDWKQQFPAMPILVTLIKHLLAMRGLNEPVNGGIGGFSVTCLVVSLLQHMPQVQSRSMVPEHHLGEVLMEFFDLYGNQFNTTTTAIQFDPPAYVPKSRVGAPYNKRASTDKFSIIDPNNSQNDIAGGSLNTRTIRACFSQCYADLQKRMGELQYSADRRHQSILACILAGNYTSFELQRDHLHHVHEKLFGPADAH